MNANFLSVFKNIRNILVVLAGNALYALAVVTFILPGGRYNDIGHCREYAVPRGKAVFVVIGFKVV